MAMKRKTKHDRQLDEWAKKANKELCNKLRKTTGILTIVVSHINYVDATCRFSVRFLRSEEDILFYYLEHPDLFVYLSEETNLDDVVTYFTSKLIAWVHNWWKSESHIIVRGVPNDENTLMKSFYEKPTNTVLKNLILGAKP